MLAILATGVSSALINITHQTTSSSINLYYELDIILFDICYNIMSKLNATGRLLLLLIALRGLICIVIIDMMILNVAII